MSINTTENLQSFLRTFVNRFITDDFRDLEEIPLEALDINVPRHAVKLICLHEDSDSLMHTLVRLIIYGLFVFLPSYLENGYFMPYVWLHENFDFVPQIRLSFIDDPQTRPIKNKNKPLETDITFRLHNIDIKDVSARRDIELIATRILLHFRNFKYSKGQIKYTYRDTANKLYWWSFFATKAEAKELFRNLCLVLIIPFNDDFIVEHFPDRNYAISEKKKVFGKTYEVERRRSGIVEFKNATLHIQGVKAIKLVDRLKTYNIDEYIQSFYE